MEAHNKGPRRGFLSSSRFGAAASVAICLASTVARAEDDADTGRGGTLIFYLRSDFSPVEAGVAMGAGYRRWLGADFTAGALLEYERPILQLEPDAFERFAHVVSPTLRFERAYSDVWSDRTFDIPTRAFFAFAGPTFAFGAGRLVGWRVGVGVQVVLENSFLPAPLMMDVQWVDVSVKDASAGHVRGGLGIGF